MLKLIINAITQTRDKTANAAQDQKVFEMWK